MSIQIELKPEVEAELQTRAQKDGIALSQYVQRILEQYLPAKPVESTMTPTERAKAFPTAAPHPFPTTRSAGRACTVRITNRGSWSTSPTPTYFSAVSTKPTPCTRWRRLPWPAFLTRVIAYS